MDRPGIAAKSCVPCRERKRKCSKEYPTCSLCYRLGRRCRYEPLVHVSPVSTSSLTSRALPTPPSTPVTRVESVTGPPIQSTIHNVITDQLKRAVGDTPAIKAVAAKYFSSVHLWFPILSKPTYEERLTNTFSQPSAEYSLLSLSMALITSVPPENGPWESVQPLYMLVKSAIGMIEAANVSNLESVQSRLLVSLFEFGHGIEPAMFISIASLARAAVAAGLNEPNFDPSCHDEALAVKKEEGFRVWWGIVMLDRNYTLERGDSVGATHGLGTPTKLPRDGNIWDKRVLCSMEPLSLSTPSSVQIGPFARQAQVSHVLGIFIRHLQDQRTRGDLDAEESDQIARTLTSFSMLLPEETPQPWPRYCGAIGMCHSALMVLHESRRQLAPSNESIRPGSPESLEGCLARVNRLATGFNSLINRSDIESVSPFPPYGLAQAASIQFRLWEDSGDMEHLKRAETLIEMIGHFCRRWRNSVKQIERLKKEFPKLAIQLPDDSDGGSN